jgi:UDP-N-acetylglucosamine 1-carboxyvinyltransferase
MRYIEIAGETVLRGKVKTPGSKNSSLALLSAACLAEEPVEISGVPMVRDVRIVADIMQEIGFRFDHAPDGTVTVARTGPVSGELDIKKSSSYRASYYFIGSLLARTGRVTLGYPGGDDFVSRPIDQHLKAFEAMGARVELFETHYTVTAERLVGADIFFDVVTSGATMNAMMAAVLAKGTTVLRNAAVDPEVVDTANFLNMLGAKIRGAGTSEIRIEGVDTLGGGRHAVIPDRLIAGSFLAAAAATRGHVIVEGVIPEHLRSPLGKLREAGLEPVVRDQSIELDGDAPLRALRIRTAMYPGFATDLQQPFTAMLLRASGRSLVTDKVYPKRFSHVEQLRRMGASVELKGASAFIQGGERLRGEWVHASDIRAGFCLLIAGFMARGVTRLTGVEHLERGCDNVIGAFRSLGADLRLSEDLEPSRQSAQNQSL